MGRGGQQTQPEISGTRAERSHELTWRRSREDGEMVHRSTDGRWLITKSYVKPSRYDHRNTSNRVASGYRYEDLITGAVRGGLDTIAEAKLRAQHQHADELAIDWTQIAGWTGNWHGNWQSYPTMEVRGVLAGTTGRTQLLTLAARDRDDTITRAHIRRWLEYSGHPDLAEIS